MDAQTKKLIKTLDARPELWAMQVAAKILDLYAQLDARATVDAQRESYISDLQEQLKNEQKARENDRRWLLEADAPGGWIHDLRIKAMSDIQPCCGEFDTCQRRCVPLAEHWKQRAESAEAKWQERDGELHICETLLAESNRKLAEVERERDKKQAEIDRLRLEFCPDEMTPEQIEEWSKHQHTVAKGE